MTLSQFIAHVYGDRPESWRVGQTLFNRLMQERPDLARHIHGTELDPFYLDERVPDVLEWLALNWGDAPEDDEK